MIPYPKRHDGEDVGQDIPFFSSPEECRRYHLTRASRYPGQFGTPSECRVAGTEALSEEDEVPILMPAGSICVISSLVVHRSGGNISERQRRVFMPQYRYVRPSLLALSSSNYESF